MIFKDLENGDIFTKASTPLILYEKIDKIKKECGCGFYNAKNLSDGSLVAISKDSIVEKQDKNEK